MSKVKLSVTVDEEIAHAVKELAGSDSMSSFINEELAGAIWRRRAKYFQDELTEEIGSPPEEIVEWAKEQISKASQGF